MSGMREHREFIIPPQPTSNYASQASQLLQQNNMMEAEICRLKNALLAEQGHRQIETQRNSMLQQELRNAQIQRDQSNKRYNEVVSERRMMIDMKTEMANRINQLEISGRHLRDQVTAANEATEAKNEEIRAITYQSEIVRQQIAVLNERNAALKAKCETVVGAQRQQCEELDAKQKQLDNAAFNVKKIEQDLQCANLEIQRLLKELENSQQLDVSRSMETRNFDEILAKKDDELRVNAYKSASELKLAHEKIDKLEDRLRTEKPAVYDSMTVESIYMAIETIKSTYEKQLTKLEEEIEVIKRAKETQTLGGRITVDGDHEEERAGDAEMIEELPAYLQTPRKPDPARMGDLKKTIQCKIKLDDDTSRTSIPLFGTTSGTTVIPENEQNSEDEKNFTEEDLLLQAESDEMISPSQDLKLMEQQLLDSEF
ncbi:Protein CBG22811 [Caenorhabditis briggsae]|uniref:Protein CBG22811 n=1 Tax=Caenorhabditis briggsae TaxID=6238 RepID=A8Y343_CAEBR|nr:Protein CBG22811 [Caenorhabditis briggsae]CAP39312.2 Protein CBG22811 [Caenorhabditis briggsae]